MCLYLRHADAARFLRCNVDKVSLMKFVIRSKANLDSELTSSINVDSFLIILHILDVFCRTGEDRTTRGHTFTQSSC